MESYVKHLIECHCTLPQYRNRPDIVYHKFPVFSLLESDSVVEKLARCNNCDAVHRVFDVCKSEIFIGDLDISAIKTQQEAPSAPGARDGGSGGFRVEVKLATHL